MKASSIILAKLFEHIELKVIYLFELCLKLKRIMLGWTNCRSFYLKSHCLTIRFQRLMQGAGDRQG